MAAKTSKTTTTKRTTKKSDAPPAIATTTSAASATTENVVTRTPSNEEIQRRAFELFVARGRTHGRAQEDWLEAERELRERYSVS